MSVTVHSHWVFIADSDGDLFTRGDAIMEALLDQEECTPGFGDVTVAADTAHSVLEIETDSVGEDFGQALATGQAAVRAALHTAGIGTPDWPTHDEVMSMALKDLHTELV